MKEYLTEIFFERILILNRKGLGKNYQRHESQPIKSSINSYDTQKG